MVTLARRFHAPVEVHRNADWLDAENSRCRSLGKRDLAHVQHQLGSYYKWKAKYGGLETSDIKRLKELEHETGCLKRMYADLSLENAELKDVIATKV